MSRMSHHENRLLQLLLYIMPQLRSDNFPQTTYHIAFHFFRIVDTVTVLHHKCTCTMHYVAHRHPALRSHHVLEHNQHAAQFDSSSFGLGRVPLHGYLHPGHREPRNVHHRKPRAVHHRDCGRGRTNMHSFHRTAGIGHTFSVYCSCYLELAFSV